MRQESMMKNEGEVIAQMEVYPVVTNSHDVFFISAKDYVRYTLAFFSKVESTVDEFFMKEPEATVEECISYMEEECLFFKDQYKGFDNVVDECLKNLCMDKETVEFVNEAIEIYPKSDYPEKYYVKHCV